MNVVVLRGRTTRDVELRYSPTGTAIAKFSLAHNRGYGDNKKTDYWNCVAFKKTAETLAERVKKGSEIEVLAELTMNAWEKDGTKHKDAELLVNRVDFINLKKSDDAPGFEDDEINF